MPSRCTRPRPAARSASATSRSSTRRSPCLRSGRMTRSRAASSPSRSWNSSSPPPPRPTPNPNPSLCRRSPSTSSTSISRPSPVNSLRSSGHRVPARRRPPTSSRGCTTSIRARSRSTTSMSGGSSSRRSGEIIGAVTQETYLFHASVRDNLRYARPEATEDELDHRGDGRLDPRARHGAARGLRHDRRRARLQAVGRREAAPCHRPRSAQGPAHPHPRRGDVGARHRLGTAHPARLRAPDGGPDDDRHRPSTVDDPARRPDHRVRTRRGRRTRHARRAARPRRPVRPALSGAVPAREPRPNAPARNRPSSHSQESETDAHIESRRPAARGRDEVRGESQFRAPVRIR